MNAPCEVMNPVAMFTNNIAANAYAIASDKYIKRTIDYVIDRCKLNSNEEVASLYRAVIGIALDEIPSYRLLDTFANTKITPPAIDEAAREVVTYTSRLTALLGQGHEDLSEHTTDVYMLTLSLVKVIAHLRQLGQTYSY